MFLLMLVNITNVKFLCPFVGTFLNTLDIGKFFRPQICADLQPNELDQICGPANERRRFFFLKKNAESSINEVLQKFSEKKNPKYCIIYYCNIMPILFKCIYNVFIINVLV